MSDLTDEPAAFPRMYAGTHQNMHGMSLRDYFAAASFALQEFHPYDSTRDAYDSEVRNVTRRAYDIADAMLKAREARHGK